MKSFNAFICIVYLISCNSIIYSQKITIGINSGINLSDIHGQEPEGKWSFKPGPVEGAFFRYSFMKSLGIQTGVDFSSVMYEHRQVTNRDLYYPAPDWNTGPYFDHETEMMDFSFLQIPLLINLTIPGRPQFGMRAGLVYSFLQDHSTNMYTYYSPYYPNREGNPRKNDFGYYFGSGISYPLNENIKASFNVSYLTGRKPFFEGYGYRHGSSEFTLGVAYNFFRKGSEQINKSSGSDSISKRVSVIYRAGINFSWNSCTRYGQHYSVFTGSGIGFSLDIPLKGGSSLQTGFMFDRLGYSIRDSSSLFYCFTKTDILYSCDTKVQIDYGTIPLLLNIPVGRKELVFINTGPWFGFRLNARNLGVAYDVKRANISTTLTKYGVYSDMEKIIKDYDYGLIAGCGVSLPVRNSKVELALQYRLGFRDVFNRPEVNTLINSSDRGAIVHNRALTFLIGIKIPSSEN